MKTRSIILRADEVRATLAGTMTVLRRPVRIPSIVYEPGEPDLTTIQQRPDGAWRAWMVEYPEEGAVTVPCPFGVVGDRLWVKETFCPVDDPDCDGHGAWIDYRATPRWGADEPGGWPGDDPDPDRLTWKSSVHMPREASRLTLEVTGVRVERIKSEWHWACEYVQND